ncbi:hypothetical protein DNTS_022049 [Danionella cerebrum]|uniref:TERF1-interacting nuclear factor 2 N-terminal domain-containing protein n=1 Tax=Danionella cerebrum TaxID=2873325 RepID=A0A553PYR5_9TELE|nr:hypothetical protein DNTS_022049 [Danionella translucida]
MAILKTTVSADGMSENLWLEKACSVLIPALPLWIIEFVWTKRMLEVLEGPPLWLEGDWQLLSLDEPCKIRAVAAEAWKIVKTRNIEHFERVIEFLDVTYTLDPRLVTPIKHMKIKFGLQTLVIIWMLWNDESMDKISEKIESFFSNNFPEYHKCKRKHLDLMKKNWKDFKSFAQLLATDRTRRETYIQESMEDQYGERYAQKLEERLSHYLEELDKVLQQPSYIEQVLKQPVLYEQGEKILKKLLSRDHVTQGAVMKRLLHYAATNPNLDEDVTSSLPKTCQEQRYTAAVVKPSYGTLHVNVKLSQNEHLPSQSSSKELFSSHGSWKKEVNSSQEEVHADEVTSTQFSDSETDLQENLFEKIQSEPEQNKSEAGFIEQICSRHGKKMRNILQECSEELHEDGPEAECTPSSSQSTPSLLLHTPHQESSNNQPDSSSTNISTGGFFADHSKTPEGPSPSLLQQCCYTSSRCTSNVNADLLLPHTEPSRTLPRLSLESQSFLMQSKYLQPKVCLSKLSKDDCARLKGLNRTREALRRDLQPKVCITRMSKDECARYIDSNRALNILRGEQEVQGDSYVFSNVDAFYSDSYSCDSDSGDLDYEPGKD